MKKCVAILLVLGMAVAAQAAFVEILLTDTYGFQTTAGAALPVGSTYLLMWSQDATMAGFDGGGSYTGFDPSLVSMSAGSIWNAYGGDVVLFAGATPDVLGGGLNIGGWFDPNFGGSFLDGDQNATYDDADVGGTAGAVSLITSGYMYGICFQDDNPAAGEYFVTTETMVQPVWADPQPPPAEINFASQTTTILDQDGYLMVPEPSTMALFGLGLLTIAWRRRKAS